LAKNRSVRADLAARGGEIGFVPSTTFGPHAAKFAAGKPGAIIGPIALDKYWGVFKILGIKPGRTMSDEEARVMATVNLMPQRSAEALRVAVEKLCARYGVVVDMNALASLVVTP
jgi:parvulin-like peptidyl-prolyl isomerase